MLKAGRINRISNISAIAQIGLEFTPHFSFQLFMKYAPVQYSASQTLTCHNIDGFSGQHGHLTTLSALPYAKLLS